MEYIEGESLSDFLTGKNPPMKDLIRISTKIAAGLAVAHKHNIKVPVNEVFYSYFTKLESEY